MTARKLDNTNLHDLRTAFSYAAHGETIHTETGNLNPYEYAGYTAACLIPDLNDTDWEIIYDAVNEAVEKAARGGSAPEDVLLFEIPGYRHGTPHLAVIELSGYVPTNLAKTQGYWISVRATLLKLNGIHKD